VKSFALFLSKEILEHPVTLLFLWNLFYKIIRFQI